MADHLDSLDRRLGSLEGQVRALREHVSDQDRTPREVVLLLAQVQGGMGQVAALIATHYLEQCLPELEAEEEDLHRDHREAVRKIIGAAR